MANSTQQQLAKQATLQFKSYDKLVNDSNFKPVPKIIKFKDSLSQKLYDITKAHTLLVFKQYILMDRYLQAAKNKHIVINDKNIQSAVKTWKHIKSNILPKFNGSRESFASYVAFEKVGFTSLSKNAMSQTYEATLKQYHVLAQQISKLKETIKQEIPNMKKALNESTDALTEASIKEIIQKPFQLIKSAFLSVLKVLVSGWAYVIKILGKVAKRIQNGINAVLDKFDNMIGRVIKYIIKSINPSFLETIKMFGGSEDDIAQILGSQVRKGIIGVAAFLAGAGFVQSAVLTFYATSTILSKFARAGEYAEIADTVINIFDELNSKYFDELMEDL